MSGWLARGLVATALGAVLAFAVTVQVSNVDLQAIGAIVMLAGIGYLVIHLALLGWERGWGAAKPPRPATVRYADPQAVRPAEPYGDQPPYRERISYPPPRPSRTYGSPQHHPEPPQSYQPDLDDTRMLPTLRDEADEPTTVVRRPERPPSDR